MSCGILMKLLQINYILIGLLCCNFLNTLAMDAPSTTIQEQLVMAARRGTAEDIQRLVDAGADIFAMGDRQNSLTMWPALLSPLMLAVNESLDLDDEAYKAKIELIINAMVKKDCEQARKDLATVLHCLESFVDRMGSNQGSNPFHREDLDLGSRFRLIRGLLLERMLPLSQEKLLQLLREKTTHTIRDFLEECGKLGFHNLNWLNLSRLFLVNVNGHGILRLIIDAEIADYDCEDKLTFIIKQMKSYDRDHLLKSIDEVVTQFCSLHRSLTPREARIRNLLVGELGNLRKEIIEGAKKYFKEIDWELSRRSDDMQALSARRSYEEKLRAELMRIDQILYNDGAENRTASQRSVEYDQLIQRPPSERREPNAPAVQGGASGGIFSFLGGY
jgi:hypothetical protein